MAQHRYPGMRPNVPEKPGEGEVVASVVHEKDPPTATAITLQRGQASHERGDADLLVEAGDDDGNGWRQVHVCSGVCESCG